VLGLPNNGSPYGTCSVSRHEANNVHEDNLAAIEYQALRLVEVATAYKIGMEQTTSQIQYVGHEVLKRFGL
jgi:NAD(P)H dehydrogenase (quinone)